MRKYSISILPSVYLLFLALLICSKASGAVKIINKTDIPLKLTGHYTYADNRHRSHLVEATAKDEKAVFLSWEQEWNLLYYRLTAIALYMPGKMYHPIVSVSVSSPDSLAGKLVLNSLQYPEVSIDGEKIKLMVDSNCFDDTKKEMCLLTIKKYEEN